MIRFAPTDVGGYVFLETPYPENYCIVSTRPGAVDRNWLSKLKFFEAQIEPMSPEDQDEFIDKWYSAGTHVEDYSPLHRLRVLEVFVTSPNPAGHRREERKKQADELKGLKVAKPKLQIHRLNRLKC